MHCMVASSIPCKLSLRADRAHACAGDSYVSSGIDVACPTSQSVFAIASPHELHGDSWPSSPTGTSSFCCNQQYSITAMTTSTGAVAERYAYTAYGQPTILDASGTVLPTSNFSIRTSYTGREWDATLGLHHFRARWMSPSAGRFIVRDPAVFFDGPNIYSFLRSKAVLGADPSGMWTEVRSICQFSYTPCNIELVGETCYCTFEIRKQCITGRRDNDSLPNHNDGWHYWLPFHRYEDSTEYEQELPVDYCGSCREMMLPEPVLPIAFQFLDDSGWVRLPDPPSVS